MKLQGAKQQILGTWLVSAQYAAHTISAMHCGAFEYKFGLVQHVRNATHISSS